MFKPGQVVKFEPKNLNPEFWNALSRKDKIHFYGSLGYEGWDDIIGKLFVFLTPILDSGGDSGHCVLVDMDDGHLEVMRHTSDFRLATKDEF